jgi:hypothetical protein
MVVAMQSGTHYVNHLYPLSTPHDGDMPYALVDYDVLKSQPQAAGQRRSLFNRYGIVTGSERLERFIIWPMGVYSPGAMRQWGRHAVAFVGRRHFDDPFYLEKMFAALTELDSSQAPMPRELIGANKDRAVDIEIPPDYHEETEHAAR